MKAILNVSGYEVQVECEKWEYVGAVSNKTKNQRNKEKLRSLIEVCDYGRSRSVYRSENGIN